MTATEIKDFIVITARQLGVNPLLALAVCRKESSFDIFAENSRSGAYGLFQLMPGTASDMGVASTYKTDWRQNVLGGVKYLRWLSDRYPSGRLDLLLAAYNWGLGNLNKLINRSDSVAFPSLAASNAFPVDELVARIPDETNDYINSIVDFMLQMQTDPALLELPDSEPSPLPEFQISKVLMWGAVIFVGLLAVSLSSRD